MLHARCQLFLLVLFYWNGEFLDSFFCFSLSLSLSLICVGVFLCSLHVLLVVAGR